MARLLDEGFATYKRHVTLRLRSGAFEHYEPSDWLARPPFNVELRTIHVDRTKLDAALRDIAIKAGVLWLRDKVVRVEGSQHTVTSVVTQGGAQISSQWYLDASGSTASLFPRLFNLPAYEFGPKKSSNVGLFSRAVAFGRHNAQRRLRRPFLHELGLADSYQSWNHQRRLCCLR